MGRRDRRHGRRRRPGAFSRWFPVAVVLAILATAVVSWRFDLGERWLGTGPDPQTEPAAVEPPAGLELPAVPTPIAVADPLTGTVRAAPAKVRRALAPYLRDRDLGRRVHAAVAGLDSRDEVFSTGSGAAMPASTTKLLTTTAALATLGPEHVFETRVVRGKGSRIVLVGGGDPLLASKKAGQGSWPERADVASLARATARELRDQGRRRVRLSYDDSLFSGPAENPHWRADYVPDGVVSPITALWVDEGRDPDGLGRVQDPSVTAGEAFASALERAGIDVRGKPQAGRASSSATELASVQSAPLARIVERVLEVSDNEAAEVLARHVGLAESGTGSSAGGVADVVSVLDRLGVRVAGAEVYDGSGLSRENRLRATTLIDVLRLAASPEHPELRSALTGLPVGGFTGSLSFRYDDAPRSGVGRVRAKTGTLTGVSALAGVVTDRDGVPLVFVLAADRVKLNNTLDARDALDNASAALAACHCAR